MVSPAVELVWPGASVAAAAVLPAVGPLIEVRDLVKRYGTKVVLDGFCLAVARGETCVLIGGSGSGKSTFARLLVGLERPDSGKILVGGVDLGGLSPRELDRKRRKFAMVFQKYALLDSMTVFDNVAFPMREARQLTEKEIAARVHRALQALDMDDAAAQLPGELSGGMAKRVGIARAVVTEPEILIYDEPTSGLDPMSARVVDGLIERMRARYSVTSIVITHDMVTAYEVADRVVLLAGGKLVAEGPPSKIFRSHGKEIELFTASSGIDVDHLAPHPGRKSVREISDRWDHEHPPQPEPPPERSWHLHWPWG